MRRGKSAREGGRAGGRRSLAGSACGPRRELGAGAPEPIGAAGAYCRARSLRRRWAGPGREGKGREGKGLAPVLASPGGQRRRGGGERPDAPRGERGTRWRPAAGPRLGGSGAGARAGRWRCRCHGARVRGAARPAASGAESAEPGEKPRARREEQRGSGEQLRGLMLWATAERRRLWTLSFLINFVSVLQFSAVRISGLKLCRNAPETFG